MSGFGDFATEDRRLCILQLLVTAPGFAAPAPVIHSALAKLFGHKVSADLLESDLAWLDEQGLLVRSHPGVSHARLKQRGMDVADGTAQVPGVRRPAPGD